jgi:hypothetical protein
MNPVSAPIRIKIFSSFCDSVHSKNVYERLSESQLIPYYGKEKSLYLTTEDDYTHAIIMNTAMPLLKNIPKENVIGLAFEPPEFLNLTKNFIDYAVKNIGRYYIGSKGSSLPDPFYEGYAYMWHTNPLPRLPEKRRLMSIMVSHKTTAPGHQYRHALVQRILASALPIDIYGRGSQFYNKRDPLQSMSIGKTSSSMENGDPRLKGEFEEIEPYEDYHFHIAIENFKTNHYFSEKITNPLLCGATPIYWGANAIDKYFPGNIIVLFGKIEEDIQLLANICSYPANYKRAISVEKVKEKINLLKNVDALFSL